MDSALAKMHTAVDRSTNVDRSKLLVPSNDATNDEMNTSLRINEQARGSIIEKRTDSVKPPNRPSFGPEPTT